MFSRYDVDGATLVNTHTYTQTAFDRSLPRCMECRRGLAMRILSVRPSVRPSVRLSVKRVDCDKTEEFRSVQMFIPYERSFSLVF